MSTDAIHFADGRLGLQQIIKLFRFNTDDEKETRFTDERILYMVNMSIQHIYNLMVSEGIHGRTYEEDVAFTISSRKSTDKISVAGFSGGRLIPLFGYIESSSNDIQYPYVPMEKLRLAEVPCWSIDIEGLPNDENYCVWWEIPGESFILKCLFVAKSEWFTVTNADDGAVPRIPKELLPSVVSYASMLALASDMEQRSLWDVIWKEQFNAYIGSQMRQSSEVLDVMG